jgi:hypothetical protein
MPGPGDAKRARLAGKVEAVEGGRARVRLTGAFEAVKVFKDEPQFSYRGAATAAGVAVYDTRRKTMVSLLLVFDGTYQQGSPPQAQPGRPLGAVIEWQQERRRPR